jgi:uncharacterized RDD family membrane protein YckC
MSTVQAPSNGYDAASSHVEAPQTMAQQVAEGKTFWVRAGAYLIDLVVLSVTSTSIGLVVGIFVGIALAVAGRDLASYGQPSRAWSWILGLVLSTAYFTLFEGLYGASVGKLILGMRVVRVDGRPCSLGAAFVRAILRLVDALFFGLVAAASMKPPLQQRLGDKAARTIVVGRNDPLVQEHRPWWLLLLAALAYLVTATMGGVLILALR